MTITTALTQMASILESNTDARKAFDDPPESINDWFPCFVLEWLEGSYQFATSGDLTNDLLTALVALYTTRQVLPTAATTARPYLTSTRNALWENASLNGACLTVENIRSFGPGGLTYGDQMYYGIRFEVDVRFKEAVSYAL